MPTLARLSDFRGPNPKRDPDLYFKNSRFTRYNGDKWEFSVEEEYPHIAAIHRDIFYDCYNNNEFFVELRRWVERRCEGDLIIDYKTMNYRWWWNRDAKTEWSREFTEIRHGYWIFYFESESDLHVFGLMHGEKISQIQELHPEYGKDILDQDRILKRV